MKSVDLKLNFKGACKIKPLVKQQPNSVNYLVPMDDLHLMRYYSSEYPFEGMMKRDDGNVRNIGAGQIEKLRKKRSTN